jgi:hypothetical protein
MPEQENGPDGRALTCDGRHPPNPDCRECQRAGLVPFPPHMPPPPGWKPPPGSPAALGVWPAPAAVKPRLSVAELVVRKRH